MHYVYILQSLIDSEKHYTGITKDLKARLDTHNNAEVLHTKKFCPWKIKTYIAFTEKDKAHQFEKYLKSGSGRAFAKKRL